MIHGQGKLVRGSIAGWVLVSKKKKRYESRLGLRKIDEMPATSCKLKKIFRKRIEKRLLNWRFRLSIPESFRLFVPHEKSELSAENTIQTTWLALLAKTSKILYPCKATVGIMGISSELFVWIFVFQKLSEISERASLTARQRSLDFRTRRNTCRWFYFCLSLCSLYR